MNGHDDGRARRGLSPEEWELVRTGELSIFDPRPEAPPGDTPPSSADTPSTREPAAGDVAPDLAPLRAFASRVAALLRRRAGVNASVAWLPERPRSALVEVGGQHTDTHRELFVWFDVGEDAPQGGAWYVASREIWRESPPQRLRTLDELRPWARWLASGTPIDREATG